MEKQTRTKKSFSWLIFALPAWVFVGFMVAQLVVVGLAWALTSMGVPLGDINSSLFNTIVAAFIYLLSVVIVIGLPHWMRKSTTNRKELGLTRLPSWQDIGSAPLAFVLYLITTGIVTYFVANTVPGFDINEVQDVGFTGLTHQYEYILAFITLVILAPVAEEVLFRGYLYGKLKRVVALPIAILVTSALFGAIHGQWNVALDTFILSVVLCGLREITGNIWAGILLHMIKNGVAYYFLFIDQSLLNMIGR